MKESKNFVDKMLRSVATVSCETASIFCFYEPKVPEQLLKKQEMENCKTVNKNV